MEMMIARPAIWRAAPRVLLNHYLGTSIRPMTPLGRAYEAPFPDPHYKMGPRAMPRQVPTLPTDPSLEAQKKAWEFFCSSISRSFACLLETIR